MEKPYMRIMFWSLSAAVLAAGVLCAGGCAQKGPIEGEYIDMTDYDVPVTEAVEVPHGMDGTLAFGATDVLLVDSVLLIVRQFSDHFIHLVDLRSGETVAKVQHVGRGPGEAVNTFCAGVSEDGEYFWAHDMQLGRINVYRMSDVLSGNGLPSRSVTFEDRFSQGHVKDVVMAEGRIYTAPEGITDDVSRFVVYDSTFNNPQGMGEWPALEGTAGLPGPAYSSVFEGSLAYIPEADRLAVAHYYEPLVSIYSMDGTLLSNTWGPDEYMQEFSVNENNATQYGDVVMYGSMVGWGEDVRSLYSTLRSHEGRLYALFTGERMSAVPEDAAVEEPAAGSRIMVLDSDGVPLEEIRTDRVLMRFDIDPETRDIWGFDGDYNLYHYKY